MSVSDLLYLIGRPLSPFYSLVMSFRCYLYSKNIFRVHTLPVPVISVGNLTMGGTGKTPTVQMIAHLLMKNGYKPAVVSRGYGGSAKNPVNIVSNGKEILLSSEEAGDEPYMLAKSIQNLPVLTGVKRYLPCFFAYENMGVDTIILDDGFQHLGVKRDLDIVLFNATTLSGKSYVFPGGELRESFKALNRADAFLLTGLNECNSTQAKAFSDLLGERYKEKPIYHSKNRVARVVDLQGKIYKKGEIQGPVFAFSGIAHPERFIDQVRSFGINLVGNIQLKDHARYHSKAHDDIINTALLYNAEALIMTEKDSVKLINFPDKLPVYCLEIEAEPSAGFEDFILEKIEISKHAKNSLKREVHF